MCMYINSYIYIFFIWMYIGICIRIIYKYLGNICQNNCIFVIIYIYTFIYIYNIFMCIYVFNIIYI